LDPGFIVIDLISICTSFAPLLRAVDHLGQVSEMPKRTRGPPAAPSDVLRELQGAQMIQKANHDGEREKLIQLLLEDD
jgi:hypothetical protein